MKRKSFLWVVMLVSAWIPALSAGIDRVEMRVQGMT